MACTNCTYLCCQLRHNLPIHSLKTSSHNKYHGLTWTLYKNTCTCTSTAILIQLVHISVNQLTWWSWCFPQTAKKKKNRLIHSNATTGCTALTNTKWIQGEKKNYVQSLSRNQFIPWITQVTYSINCLPFTKKFCIMPFTYAIVSDIDFKPIFCDSMISHQWTRLQIVKEWDYIKNSSRNTILLFFC